MRRCPLTVVVFLAAAWIGPRALAQDAEAPTGAESSDDAAQASAADRDVPAGEAQPTADQPRPADAKKDAADPNGAWRWERRFQDNAARFTVRLDWDGKELTGTYSAFGVTSDIEDGRFEKGELSFVSKREFNGNEFEVRFKGKVEGDEIRGALTVDFGQGPQEFEWNPKRTVLPEDVLGTWKLRVETARGVVEPQITITQKGDALHGDYESPFGRREAKNVTLKEGELSWEISSDEGGGQFGPFKVVYKGKPRGNKIAGKSEFDFSGNTGEAEFTGKRTPPKDEDEANEGSRAAGEPGASATDDQSVDDRPRRPPADEP